MLLIAATASLPAREFTVDTPATLAAALRSAGADDVITLGRGHWTDLKLTIDRGGTAGHPLEIRAAIPGETLLDGSSALAINAPYVIVDGLFFYQGAITKGTVIEFGSHHGIVRNTAVVDYNPAAFETRYYWVFFSGDNNLLERCYFKGKNNLEPLVGNAIEGSRHNTVANCYFKNIPYAENNGREDIRVWGAGKFDAGDQGGAFFTIEHNLFDHADGEGAEIISLKSNHNQVLNNTVTATRGCINIRQGSYNLIQGNVVLGRGVPGAQGLRMSGLHNIVKGNYISDCDFGIRVSSGEYVASALTASYQPNLKTEAKGKTSADGRIATYPQVKDLTLSENVTVGIAGADLEIGFAYKRRWPEQQMVLIPESCLVKDNRFVRPQGGDSVIGTVPDVAPPLDQFRFEPNRYEGNHLVGGKNAYALAPAGWTSEPVPPGWTAESEQSKFKILTAKDVGPAWVIAFRTAGKFPMEADNAPARTSAGSPAGRKKAKS
jgi:poly(beta-D-mannuronate) lyase